ncbi:zinc transporter ZIP3-like [Glandiceps talaboti]
MELLLLQIIFMVAIFSGTIICGLLPMKVISRKEDDSKSQSWKKRSQRVLAICNCFSGGIFLGTCFLTVVPAAGDKLEEIFKEKGIETNYPVNEFIVMFGFVFILFIEQTVLTCQECKYRPDVDSSDEPYLELLERGSGDDEEEIESNHGNTQRRKLIPKTANGELNHEHHSHHHHHHHHHDHSEFGHSHLHLDHNSSGTIRSAILLLALSSHSLLEGMAFGLQENTAQTVNLFIGIIVHECLASFAFGVSLVGAKQSNRIVFCYVLLFCVMIPVGMVVGISVQTSESLTGQIASAVLQSFAAGTFIHVTFFEILSHEFEKDTDRIIKVLFLTFGIGAMAVLQFFGS